MCPLAMRGRGEYTLEGVTPWPNVKAKVEEAQKTLDLDEARLHRRADTSKGPIRLKFFPDVAPGHVKNFWPWPRSASTTT